MLPLYEALKEKLGSAHPDTAIRISKAPISFRLLAAFRLG